MIRIRPSEERGRNKLNWLDTHFTFSFDQYYDPEHTQFRSLRVLNEDIVAPGQGFGMHPHRDMEILTWILERDKFLHVAGPEAPVTIHQDANLFIARLGERQEAKLDLKADRHAWVQVARGGVVVNGNDLNAGDGAAISKEEEVRVKAKEASEVLLFDLA